MNITKDRYWEYKRLDQLSQDEWENLCDGCAQCCQMRVRCDESKQLVMIPITCELLDLQSCRCTKYTDRHRLVPNCVELTPENVTTIKWLPETCAYRLIGEGKPLFEWHPLIAGNRKQMEEQGISVAHRAVSARNVHPDDLSFEVLKWVK
ncbi:MAG: YcgN family cysteine cluster protein [Gammaproteobacteria bacterium]|nr:YcgN family cysteine cluster protein [Gammaproteobacteria bacterium]MYF53251.1 YcgN family cysteine cluster protein [Gammaproteobacteria bacterium]MYK44572.1 YcgN family cysteine cluster protein [Gammaproteobacteria bacterium]